MSSRLERCGTGGACVDWCGSRVQEKENTRRAKANQFNEALLAHRAARSNYAAQRDAEAQDPDTVKVMSMADFDFRDPEKLKRSTAIEETEAELKAELPWKRVVAEEYFPDGDMNLTKRVAAFKVCPSLERRR
jgi:hypothetical protein